MGTWDIDLAQPDGPAATTLLRGYLDEIIARFHGRPATVAEVDDELAGYPAVELRPPNGAFLVATVDGEPAGCAGVRLLDPATAELKGLFVRPRHRGGGLGAELVAAAERHATALGARVLRLDTRGDLVEARRLYARGGFAEIPDYNAAAYAEHWFEKRL